MDDAMENVMDDAMDNAMDNAMDDAIDDAKIICQESVVVYMASMDDAIA